MWPFEKTAQQKRIDADAEVIAELRKDKAALESRLAARNLELIRVRSEKVTVGKLADELLKERDEARSQLLRFTGPRDRGPGGRFVTVQAQRPNGTAAAVQGVASHG